MRWRRSDQKQIDDRRGDASGGMFGGSTGGLGSGGMGIPIPIGGGVGGIIVFIIFLVLSGALNGLGGSGSSSLPGGGGAFQSLNPNDDPAQFVNSVTVDVQTFWEGRFQQLGKTYPDPVTVLFTGSTQSGCGIASSQTGQFYCPSDQKVYLDTAFFDELASRFGAPGKFAQAYVIAHEFGHHVQDALGIMDQVASEQQSSPSKVNDLSIRLELEADCLAGVWANSVWAKPDEANVESITDSDIRDGLSAAAAVGDDRFQQQATGRIDKESWTHGSSDQRTHWFQTGFQQGTVDGCDTFSVAQP